MPFSRSVESRYTAEQKTAYKVFYFCLSIVVVGTVVLISSLRYSESNVVKEIIGVILVILGASLCYFMCLQIRKSAAEAPKPQDSQSSNNQLIMTDNEEGMACVIVDSSGKLILHPLSGNIPLSQRPSGEPPLLVMSSATRDSGTINCQNLASSSQSVVVPWPLSMNRRRQLAQISSRSRESNRNCVAVASQTTVRLPVEPPPYSTVDTTNAPAQSTSASSYPQESPPAYEDAVRSPPSSTA